MTVTLSWTDTKNPPGTQYDVYRSPYGTVSNYSKVASAVTGTTYTDNVTLPGAFTYYVTAIVGGVESDSSNTVTASPVVFPPTSLAAVVT
jgi:hypothetical protein